VSALILSGKEVAAKVLADVKASVAALGEKTGVHPTLAVILVGEDPASQIYVRNKKRAADEVGITTRDYLFPQGCTQAELLATIAGINRDPAIHGILLQLPLPKGMDEDAAVAAIAPEKDADGLHPVNLGNLLGGKPGAVPCTPAGCMEILDHYRIPIEGAEAVVVGRSRLVGKSLAQLLLARVLGQSRSWLLAHDDAALRVYAPVSKRLITDVRTEQYLWEIADAFSLRMEQLCLQVARALLDSWSPALQEQPAPTASPSSPSPASSGRSARMAAQ